MVDGVYRYKIAGKTIYLIDDGLEVLCETDFGEVEIDYHDEYEMRCAAGNQHLRWAEGNQQVRFAAGNQQLRGEAGNQQLQ